jgi:GTPase
MSNNIVAIVGRPNVGKSTLYNRLVGRREAIVDDESGVTRDRQYGTCEWGGKQFMIVDTGGFVQGSDDIFEAEIRRQVRIAIEEAEIIIFMTDSATGITDLDDEVANLLRRSKKPVCLAVNKVDNSTRLLDATEFYSMGFEDIFFLSSMTGSGTGELLDRVAELVIYQPEMLPDIPKLAIIGQPNVGKSSLTNALLGEERHIVTDLAGTTRDSIHSRYTKFGHDFMVIDTAGIRKKAKVHEDLEFYSVMRALKAIEDADICLLVIDATLGVESQDLNLFRIVREKNKGVVVLVNKWDLVPNKVTNTALTMEKEIRERLRPFSDVPILFISALEKQRIFKAVEVAMEVHVNRSRRIKTSELNEFLEEVVRYQAPPTHRGAPIKINYGTQLPIAYPAFAFFSNHPKHIKESYRNYLENRIRERWNFTGVPLSIFFRDK